MQSAYVGLITGMESRGHDSGPSRQRGVLLYFDDVQLRKVGNASFAKRSTCS